MAGLVSQPVGRAKRRRSLTPRMGDSDEKMVKIRAEEMSRGDSPGTPGLRPAEVSGRAKRHLPLKFTLGDSGETWVNGGARRMSRGDWHDAPGLNPAELSGRARRRRPLDCWMNDSGESMVNRRTREMSREGSMHREDGGYRDARALPSFGPQTPHWGVCFRTSPRGIFGQMKRGSDG